MILRSWLRSFPFPRKTIVAAILRYATKRRKLLRRAALAGTTGVVLWLGLGVGSVGAWADASALPVSPPQSVSASGSPSPDIYSVVERGSLPYLPVPTSSVPPIWSDVGPQSDEWRSEVDAATVIALGLIVLLLAVIAVGSWR